MLSMCKCRSSSETRSIKTCEIHADILTLYVIQNMASYLIDCGNYSIFLALFNGY